ncbi:MAG: hypothetical protein WD050_02150 [Actinomycetota bacterium]
MTLRETLAFLPEVRITRALPFEVFVVADLLILPPSKSHRIERLN